MSVDKQYERYRHNAHVKVQKALKRGALSRPQSCQKCGATPPPIKNGRASIQGHHHKGYDYPLDVEWLELMEARLRQLQKELA